MPFTKEDNWLKIGWS